MTATDPVEVAHEAGLRYVDDRRPGIRRKRNRSSFSYIMPDGAALRDERELERIRKLAVPPAYEDVWICPIANGHLQATGRDARGRKQYRYHARWRETRDANKFESTLAFAAALPEIRRRVEADLASAALSRNKVLAAVVRLLETTLVRVGNEEYARANGSFGLTTLRGRHVKVDGASVRFHFRGKSGVDHAIRVTDRRLASIVRRCKDLPGQELFQYVDEDGTVGPVRSDDVNDYIREISGGPYTAKDFRTWAATVACALELDRIGEATSTADAKRIVAETMRGVASRLGNTPAVCRKSYVHPSVVETFLDERRIALPRARAVRRADAAALEDAERRVVAFLRCIEDKRRSPPDLTPLLERSVKQRRAVAARARAKSH